MIKKILVIFGLFSWFSAVSYADLRKDIADYFKDQRNYRGAVDYLLNHFEKTQGSYDPVLCGLLAFSYHKLDDKSREYEWLTKYLEYYRGEEFIFDFLDEATYRDLLIFIGRWKQKYPLVTELALIDRDTYQGPYPPDKFIIGIEIENDAYFKFSDEEGAIKGGLFKRGFNSISIAADALFDRSGSHVFFLDLKTEDLVLRKEIEIDIRMDLSGVTQEDVESQKKSASFITEPEFKISMYVGDELIASSRKMAPFTHPINIDLPPWPKDPSVYGPIYRDEFALNYFSILDAVGAVYELLKSLKKGDKGEGSASSKPLQKRMQITANFLRKDLTGKAKEIQAVITLKTRHLKTSPLN
jgi:hypothetical protein